jgi:hypothetical protein
LILFKIFILKNNKKNNKSIIYLNMIMSIKENNNKSINNTIEKNSLSLFIYKLIFILVLLKIIFYKKVYKIL